MKETDLSHGATEGVRLRGDVVHKPRGPNSVAIEGLLEYLSRRGFRHAPRWLGNDEQDRQMLTYNRGVVGHYPAPGYVWNDANLVRACTMLREFHDITAGFAWQDYSGWLPSTDDPGASDVICHNDFATYNCVFSGEQPAMMIDFDLASPGSRLWDVACFAFRWIPIVPLAQQQRWGVSADVRLDNRLQLLLQTYGIADEDNLLGVVATRIASLRQATALIAGANNAAGKRIRDERHLDSYDAALDYVVNARAAGSLASAT